MLKIYKSINRIIIFGSKFYNFYTTILSYCVFVALIFGLFLVCNFVALKTTIVSENCCESCCQCKFINLPWNIQNIYEIYLHFILFLVTIYHMLVNHVVFIDFNFKEMWTKRPPCFSDFGEVNRNNLSFFFFCCWWIQLLQEALCV